MAGPKAPVSVNYKLGPYWKLTILALALYASTNLVTYAMGGTYVSPPDALAGAWRVTAWAIRWGVAAVHKLRSTPSTASPT